MLHRHHDADRSHVNRPHGEVKVVIDRRWKSGSCKWLRKGMPEQKIDQRDRRGVAD